MSPSAAVYSIVNAGLANYFVQIYSELMDSFGVLFYSLLTLYIIYVGYCFMMNEKGRQELMEMLKSCILVTIVFGFVFSTNGYFNWVIKPVLEQLTTLTSFLMSKISTLHSMTGVDDEKIFYFREVHTLKQLFSNLDAMFLDFIKGCLNLLPSGWTEILSPNAIFNLIGVIVICFAFGAMYTGFAIIFIMSYFILWILFYVGGIVLLLACFKATRQVFFAWIRQIANHSLVIIFTTIVVAVCYSGVSLSVYTMTQYDSSMWTFTEDFLSLICWCFVCLAITLKTPDLAAAFTQQMAGATTGIAGAISTAGGVSSAGFVSASAFMGRNAISATKAGGQRIADAGMNAYERLKASRGTHG